MSLKIVIDADVQNATQNIDKFVYHYKQAFQQVQKASAKAGYSIGQSTQQMTEKMESFGKDSRIALTNLSLVLQDLPYGFIGIQNNLPFLVKSFTDLTTKTNSITGAFKEIGAALIGPAGLFLAFSAVTSAITFAVQEYGSLGKAIDAIFQKNTALSASQLKYNEVFNEGTNNIADEIAKIRILTKILTDSNSTRQEQLAAYRKLNEIAPEILSNMSKENALTDEGRKLIAAQAEVRIELLKLKVRENAISAVINDLQQKEFIANGKLIAAKQDYAKALVEEQALKEKAFKGDDRATGEYLNASNAVEIYKGRLDEARAELFKIYDTQKNWTSSLQEAIVNIAAIEERVGASTEAYKAQVAALKKAAKEQKKVVSAEELARQARYAANKLQEQADKNRIRALEEQARLLEKITKETFKQADKAMAEDAKGFTLGFQKLEEVTKPLAEYEKAFLQTKIYLEQSIFRPLEDVFEIFFEKGTSGFKEMGNVIIAQVRKIAAQIIASGIIQLIASLINPIGAVQAGGPNALNLFSILGNATKNVLSGRMNRPSLGGITGGGMTMGGQVSVVLRGQDLVGALNRTNLQIERLG